SVPGALHKHAPLKLDEFWAPRLTDSREGTSWYHVLMVLAAAPTTGKTPSTPPTAAADANGTATTVLARQTRVRDLESVDRRGTAPIAAAPDGSRRRLLSTSAKPRAGCR